MPGVISNCECITSVRGEWHLRLFRFSAVGQHLVKDGADMRCRIIGRQIELDSDAFPKAVCMFEDAISRNIAGEDWYGIHSRFCNSFRAPVSYIGWKLLHE